MKYSEFLADQDVLSRDSRVDAPMVSVVMPTYCRNSEGWLARSIDSVLAQSITDLEFIIVDDGSVDGSEDVIRGYTALDNRVVYVRHSMNSGLPALRANEGIMLARAPLVSFMFDDNVWDADALASMHAGLKAAEVDMVHASLRIPRPDGGTDKFGSWPPSLSLLHVTNTIPNGAVMCRRRFFDRYGLFDPHLIMRRIADWDLWLRAIRLGARFSSVGRTIGTEYGRISEQSLGNTVAFDVKVSVAYMQDPDGLDRRARALVPDHIFNLDVFDPEVVMKYVRDWTEWDAIEKEIYKPYFDLHPQVPFEAPVRHNRRFDAGLTGYALNPPLTTRRSRRRVLLVANMLTRVAQDWANALAADPKNILLCASEWSALALSPAEFDQVILFDCTSAALSPTIQHLRDNGASVVYVIEHGLDTPSRPRTSSWGSIAMIKSSPAYKENVPGAHFSEGGNPWQEAAKRDAETLMSLADQVFSIGQASASIAGVTPLPFVPNGRGACDLGNGSIEPAVYVRDPSEIGQQSASGIALWATEIGGHVRCFTDGSVGDIVLGRGPTIDGLHRIPTNESLPVLAATLERTLLVVPEEELRHYSPYHQMLIQEDLVVGGGALNVASHHSDGPQPTPREQAATARASWERIAAGRPPGARHLMIQNIARGVALRKRIADARGEPRASSVRGAVLINSQLLAGSEAYGLLVGSALSSLGFDVRFCGPGFDEYKTGDSQVNTWLKERKQPSLQQLEYGRCSRLFFMSTFPKEDAVRYGHRLARWLDDERIGLVICSGFIPEAVIQSPGGRFTYMALFAPWGYALDRMTFLRDRIANFLSDTKWAAQLWSSAFGRQVATIPSIVEPQHFRCLNGSLPPTPIRIAVVGTIQPRKRQLEAVMAVAALIAGGHDLEMNLYGYQLEGFKEYIDSVESAIDEGGLGQRIRLHGFVEDATEIAANNHIVLSAAIDESMPQALVFNQASGLLPVACPAGGIDEVVVDGETGFLAKGFDVGSIAHALEQAISHRSDWPVMIARGHHILLADNSQEVVIARLLDVLEDGAQVASTSGLAYFGPSSQEPSTFEDHSREQLTARGPGLRLSHAPAELATVHLAIGPDVRKAPIIYPLSCKSDGLSGLRFCVGTYYTRPSGMIRIHILRVGTKQIIRSLEAPAQTMIDNGWVELGFETVSNSGGSEFAIAVSAELQNGRLAIYEHLRQPRTRLDALVTRTLGVILSSLGITTRRSAPAFHPTYVGGFY